MLAILKTGFKSIFSKDKNAESKVDLEKSALRYEVSILKKKADDAYKQERSKLVFDKIEHFPEFQAAKTILMYWSLSDELPTHDFIKKWSRTKTILLPVVKHGQMTVRPFVSEDELSKGSLSVMEPKSSKEHLKSVDIAIIPGVAFDRKKRRLGRGKGYYDKYLKKKRIQKWGVCCDFQLFDKIPATRHDIKMNRVIAPTETVW